MCVHTYIGVQKQDRAKQKSKLTKRGNYKSRRALNEGQNAQQFLESLTEALNSMGKENQGTGCLFNQLVLHLALR